MDRPGAVVSRPAAVSKVLGYGRLPTRALRTLPDLETEGGRMESQPASAFGLKDEDFETAPLSIGSTHEDTSNSERFVRRNKGHVYYSPRRKAWIRYDGQRWERDDGKEVIGRAKETAKSIYQEAATLNDEEAIKRGRWAERSLNRARVEAMTELAKPAMVVDDELFDANDF